MSHISKKRTADILLDFTTNSTSIVIVFLQELSKAFQENPYDDVADTISTYLRRNPRSILADLLDEKRQEQKFLTVSEEILQKYVEQSVNQFEPARILLASVLSQSILGMTLSMCSKAEWINDWIIYLLQDSEPDLISALDSGFEQSFSNKANNAEELTVNNDIETNYKMGEKDEDIKLGPVFVEARHIVDHAADEVQKLNDMIAKEDAKKESIFSPKPNEIQSDNSDIDYGQDRELCTERTDVNCQENTGAVVTYQALKSSPKNSAITTSNNDSLEHSNITFSDSAQFSMTNVERTPNDNVLSQISDEDIPPTFHETKVAIINNSADAERSIMRSKPTDDFLVQVEPASNRHLGWVIGRGYSDFETLHEIIRRISVISGVPFTETHANLPNSKGKSYVGLCTDLEKYLNDALLFQSLAESEGMKRFLRKDNVYSQISKEKTAFNLETVGKGVRGVFGKAPKDMIGGGKTLIGGMNGVFGGRSSTQKKPHDRQDSVKKAGKTSSSKGGDKYGKNDLSSKSLSETNYKQVRLDSNSSIISKTGSGDEDRKSDYRRSSDLMSSANTTDFESNNLSTKKYNLIPDGNGHSTLDKNTSPAVTDCPPNRQFNFQSPPSKITNDISPNLSCDASNEDFNHFKDVKGAKIIGKGSVQDDFTPDTNGFIDPKTSFKKVNMPLTTEEAQITIELIFAGVNELYSLSSAWNIRKALLNAAKTYLLRPNNPHLEQIRTLLQAKLIDENSSDEAIASYINNLRRNIMPTGEEINFSSRTLSDDKKTALRERAKELLVSKSMPQALNSVMGAVASKEALGKVFDCLQLENVARGLIFGLLLQVLQVLS